MNAKDKLKEISNIISLYIDNYNKELKDNNIDIYNEDYIYYINGVKVLDDDMFNYRNIINSDKLDKINILDDDLLNRYGLYNTLDNIITKLNCDYIYLYMIPKNSSDYINNIDNNYYLNNNYLKGIYLRFTRELKLNNNYKVKVYK